MEIITESIWARTAENVREAVAKAALHVSSIDPYDAEQFCASVIDDHKAEVVTGLDCRFEFALRKPSLTRDPENELIVATHSQTIVRCLASTGLTAGLELVIRRLLTHEMQHQIEVYLERRHAAAMLQVATSDHERRVALSA